MEEQGGESNLMDLPVAVDVDTCVKVQLCGKDIDCGVGSNTQTSNLDVALRVIEQCNVPPHEQTSVVSLVDLLLTQQRQKILDERDDIEEEHEGIEDGDEEGDEEDPLLSCWIESLETSFSEFQRNSKAVDTLDTSTSSSMEHCNEDDIEFSHKFNELIHSSLMHDLLHMEGGFVDSVVDLIDMRDRKLQQLEDENAMEIERLARRASDGSLDDSEMTHLLRKQAHNYSNLKINLNTKIKMHKQAQKQQYRDIVERLYQNPQQAMNFSAHGNVGRIDEVEEDEMGKQIMREKQQKSVWNMFKFGDQQTDVQKPKPTSSANKQRVQEEEDVFEPQVESFTVTLGTQKKIEHNLRIMTGDIIDMCRVNASREEEVKAQRFSTALNLYSQNLSAVVLIVDTKLSSETGVKANFASLCERSTELHFEELPEQIRTLQVDLQQTNSGYNNTTALKPGDFYITRHSNLSSAQVVFHLVADPQVYSTSFSSQSNMLKGLRNIVRCMFQNDIQTISLPLLLVHDYEHKMDERFCERRCDLVLKTLKGFIMENTAWGRETSKTIQLVLPKATTPDIFSMFVDVTSSIFKQTRDFMS
eukprot:m.83836 g.83836  ORF g.83836 m.83836 type:complete len:587 (-) comp12135_c0_seq3:525-2285(-)